MDFSIQEHSEPQVEKNLSKHIIINMPKVENKYGNFKASREKHQVIFRKKQVRISFALSEQTLNSRRP